MTFALADVVGGLGNQLFILANLFAYAKRFAKYIVIDTKQLVAPSSTYRKTYWSSSLMSRFLKPNAGIIDIGTADGLQKFCDIANLKPLHVYNEPYFHYSEIPDFDASVHLKGYFQSALYFQDHAKEISDFFRLDNADVRFEKNKDTVSVHVRRGDYLNFSNYHTVLPIEYYRTAIINHFPIAKRFLLFSDDIEWLKENKDFFGIPGDASAEICTIEDEVESFYEMQSCGAGHIIANSSFSWWAAYLGCGFTPNSQIVAPLNWFGPDGPKNHNDIYMQNWTLI